MKQIYIYDLEILDIFTATFLERETLNKFQFIITKDIDQRKELFEFLNNEVGGLIGFNCINFDSQVLEYMYRNPNFTLIELKNYVNLLISSEKEFLDVPEWKLRIPHLDLYKIHHFDNKNKRTGLKWCEFMMRMDNIEDMPLQGTGNNWVEQVLSYNYNDCVATNKLYVVSRELIDLRNTLTSMYKLNLQNASNSKIGSEILLDLYCKKTGKLKSDIRSLRTYRKHIDIGKIIFPYIRFESTEFNTLLKTFKDSNVSSTKGELEFSIKYKGFQFDYGSGGIHGSVKNKVIISDDEYVIIDCDVSSLYPSIGVVNKLYPKHLGPAFYEVYKHDIVDVRLAEKARGPMGNKAIINGFKEAANSAYGKSNDKFSWLYDPQYTLSITVNGQLLLTMLSEQLFKINNLQIIQVNTDGITVRLPKTELSNYYRICNDWQKLTNLQLEYAEYSKMIIFDVNNYLAFYTNGKYKAKGKCEFENVPLHKNQSHNIIPLTFYNYFKNNILVDDFIKSHNNIFDFCAGVKSKRSAQSGQSHYELHYIKDGNLSKDKLSKTVRYYISNKGKYLIKCYENGSQEHVEAPKAIGKFKKDWKVTYFNKTFYPEKFENYNIDYSYYISKTKDWIYSVENKQQLTMFQI